MHTLTVLLVIGSRLQFKTMNECSKSQINLMQRGRSIQIVGHVCTSHGEYSLIVYTLIIGMWNNLHTVRIEIYIIKLYKEKYNKQMKINIYIYIHLENISEIVLDIVSSKTNGKAAWTSSIKMY